MIRFGHAPNTPTRPHQMLLAFAGLTIIMMAACGTKAEEEPPPFVIPPACADTGAACVEGGDCCSEICEADLCVDEASCREEAAACTEDSECCDDLTCVDDACTAAAPECAADEEACEANDDCCSSICENDICVAEASCTAEGEACEANEDCCSNSCVDDACAAVEECAAEGDACEANDDCCSSICENDLCVAEASCTADGEACAGHDECCSGTCQDDVCVPDEDPCTVDGEACAANDECCSNLCEDDVCVDGPSCGADGDACAANDDCCSSICDNDICVAEIPCTEDDAACESDDECCSSICEDGTCGATPCLVDTSTCEDHEDCCSGVCAAGVCADTLCGDDIETCICGSDTECGKFDDGLMCTGKHICNDTQKCEIDQYSLSICTIDTGDPCTEFACAEIDENGDGKGDCALTNLEDGIPCDDNNVCTEETTCQAAVCQGTQIACSDDNPCTDDLCDSVEGCQYPNNTADCDDSNPCTGGIEGTNQDGDADVCTDGACVGADIYPCNFYCGEDGDDDANHCDPWEICLGPGKPTPHCEDDCGKCLPECGDTFCENGENDTINKGEDCGSCPLDCGACPGECGDETCNPNETCGELNEPALGEGCPEGQTCECNADCDVCPPECGDGECNGTENCFHCPVDCGGCEGNCQVDHDGPGCNVYSCSACVCSYEGNEGCCESAWDPACVSTAEFSCEGTCPKCGNDECEQGEDCETCPGDCGQCKGPCCADNGSPECDDVGALACVCSVDDSCCDLSWDSLCAATAALLCNADCSSTDDNCGDGWCAWNENCQSCELDCGQCQHPCGDGSCDPSENCQSCPEDCGVDTDADDIGDSCTGACCEPNGSPGCSTHETSLCTCALDPYCCEVTWGELCVDTADTKCGAPCGECGDDYCDPDAEDCTSCPEDCGVCSGSCCVNGVNGVNDNGGVGCKDGPITTCVCEISEYCCEALWDIECTAIAEGTSLTHPAETCNLVCPTCADGICQPEEDCYSCAADCGECLQNCGNGFVELEEHCANCPEDAGQCDGFCCWDNGSAGCNDTDVALCVCAGNSFCCEVTWDGECVTDALADCSMQCPTDSDGTCENGENETDNRGETCINAPNDCGACQDGDGFCASPLENCWLSPIDCGECIGDCCAANGSSGCDSVTVTDCVCNDEPYCCEVSWVDTCAGLAHTCGLPESEQGTVCPFCGDAVCNGGETEQGCPGDCGGAVGCGFGEGCHNSSCAVCQGDCCSVHGAPGCDDSIVTDYICDEVDLACCQDGWGDTCVEFTQVLAAEGIFAAFGSGLTCPVAGDGACEGGEVCYDAGVSGDCGSCSTQACDSEHESEPGCNSQSCMECVCGLTAKCCQPTPAGFGWDAACASTATSNACAADCQ